jgi:release factor glutamine methyltransferase
LEWRNNLINIHTWQISASGLLDGKSQFPRLEAQVILAHYLNKSKTWILAHPEEKIPDLVISLLDHALIRLVNGEPLAYITGTQEFFCLPFFVSPATLIPRPETELMVDKAVQWLKINPEAKLAADIGTGCGCIAISISKSIRSINFLAVDVSHNALQIARRNIIQHGLNNRIQLIQGNLLNFLAGKMDLICANLPYIPSLKINKLETSRFEPRLALDGGNDGLVLIRELLEKSRFWLQNPGLLLIEFESGQEDRLNSIASNHYPKEWITIHKDLAGKPRLMSITTTTARKMV